MPFVALNSLVRLPSAFPGAVANAVDAAVVIPPVHAAKPPPSCSSSPTNLGPPFLNTIDHDLLPATRAHSSTVIPASVAQLLEEARDDRKGKAPNCDNPRFPSHILNALEVQATRFASPTPQMPFGKIKSIRNSRFYYNFASSGRQRSIMNEMRQPDEQRRFCSCFLGWTIRCWHQGAQGRHELVPAALEVVQCLLHPCGTLIFSLTNPDLSSVRAQAEATFCGKVTQ